MSAAFRRRRGHRETPIVACLIWILCTLGVGALTVIRDAKRAERSGAILDAVEKWTAFGRGCAWGTATFLAFLVALFVFLAVVFWLENWRWKRDAKRKQKL